MMEFDEWCEAEEEVVNGHDLKVLFGSDDHLVDVQDKADGENVKKDAAQGGGVDTDSPRPETQTDEGIRTFTQA
jgi:hypothetical protein